eukprot:474300_1
MTNVSCICKMILIVLINVLCVINGECLNNEECSMYECTFKPKQFVLDASINSSNINGFQFDESAEKALILATSTGITFGINVQDNIILISLLFINIVTALFIVIGLNTYDSQHKFKEININYITLIIIFIQFLLVSAMNISATPIIDCTLSIGSSYYVSPAISWLDLIQYILCGILSYIWCKHAFIDYVWCKYFILILSIPIPLIIAFSIGSLSKGI